MYDYIAGKLVALTPTHAVIDVQGVGYYIHITLTTYEAIKGKNESKLFVSHIVREDASLLYGFEQESERKLFELLIQVSGIGPNTGRMILASLLPTEVIEAISREDVDKIKSVKGIGLKTAQRIIIDLKDKVTKLGGVTHELPEEISSSKEEAIAALLSLGFTRKNIQATVDKIYVPTDTTNSLIRKALKHL